MTDKEMLELAAKAAGYSIWEWERDGSALIADPIMQWRPLKDDGDALRLAVDLRLIVRCYEGLIIVDGGGSSCEERVFSDRRAAVRRAIVRVAAEIGRAHP